jgi:MFS family permease
MLLLPGGTMSIKKAIFHKAVLVSALGYFVDIYDLLLFSIVRVSSLKDLGFSDTAILEKGMLLINAQMSGLLIGGIIWGIWGDKKGRLSVLFGSIFLYSVANLLNAFVQDLPSYIVLRFIAGLGLAGELGAAITLVSEVLSKENRGFGTTIVASFGILGAVVAGIVGGIVSWRTSYIIGGVMGLSLLILRFSVKESPLFLHSKNKNAGNLLLLFQNKNRLLRFLSCIAIGVPLWFVVGILISFAPEMSQAWNLNEPITAAKAIMFNYAGLSLGDLLSGLLSQWIKSRKKVVGLFLILDFILMGVYIWTPWLRSDSFYTLCFLLGIASGYWAVFVTIAAEQFGTNLRATVATTTPNFVRGTVVLLTTLLQWGRNWFTLPQSALMVGLVAFGVALWGYFRLEESFGKDLHYFEEPI